VPAPPKAPAAVPPPDESEKERGPDAAPLSRRDQAKAAEEEALDAPATHEVIRREGAKELDRTPSALAWSGLAAGLSMGLTMVAEGLLRAHLPDTPWRPLITKLGYPVGFLVVILGSQQLYTENTILPVVPYMAKRSGEILRKLLRLWGIVLIANLVGALLFALAAAHTDMFSVEVHRAFAEIGREAMQGTAAMLFLRGIVAGWIIALMVWMLPASGDSKIFVIFVMTWLVGAGQLAHIIAGSVEVMYFAAIGGTSFGSYLTHYMLPTLLGNTLGGVALVAMINHAQVVAGQRSR
jgi:formate/nitrite transporter FocA (FNT family)